MMKTSIAAGLLTLLALCGPAQAQSKYNCEFQKDGTSLQKCTLNSATAPVCEYAFAANLRGVCGVAAEGFDILFCVLTTPAGAAPSFAAGLPRGSAAAAARALAQKPGFVAGGLTFSQPSAGTVAGAYVEKQGAPTLAGVCTP